MRTIKILCIEDNLGDVRLIKEVLREDRSNRYIFEVTGKFKDVHRIIKKLQFDVILLDLTLPDISGLETIEGMKALMPEIPIIVLTGMQDEIVMDNAIKKGAQDYLQKGAITTPLLTRSIKYAIDRNSLMLELEKLKQIENQKREMASLDKLSPKGSVLVTEKALGIKSLREVSPGVFNEFAQKFENALKLIIENKLYKTNHNTTNELQTLASEFGTVRAGPKDVVEIYSTVLKRKINNSNLKASQTYLEDGRLMLLEVMGYLVNYYRKYSIGI